MTVRLREAQALADGREWRQRVVELETQVGQVYTGTPRWTPKPYHDHPPLAAVPSGRFQDNIHRNLLNRVEAERAALQEKLQYLAAQNKGLQTQLSESRRKQAEAECKVQPLPGPLTLPETLPPL